ncbi:MAG TPA: thermonuclease family protein [Gammaproteobacteria bacterium]|nr:thermonuclease family protein [Gammaproteobacteria bacterium]
MPGRSKKAPLGAFLLCFCWQTTAGADPDCGPPPDTTPVRVRYAYDGDTLTLTDNRRVRLIGVNTPELGREGRAPQALAIRARDRLRQRLFAAGQQLRLAPGAQKEDRYGRRLANLWTPKGENLAAALLREGLGWYVAIRPNVRYIECYRAAEAEARRARRGVWGHPAWRVRQAGSLRLRDTGFALVQGRIRQVHRGSRATWIDLDGPLTLRLQKRDLLVFPQAPDHSWQGQTVEVRGWLYRVRDRLRLDIQHPASLRRLDTAPLAPAKAPD